MIYIFLLIIFFAALAGGSLPVYFKSLHPRLMTYVLAFTGAFLFGITVLHLIPETFETLGAKAGIYIVLGFFLQVILQQLSHGIEHGHSPSSGVPVHLPASSLLLGLSVHAFLEGLPLGYHYADAATLPSLVTGIAVHKFPEAFTLMSLFVFSKNRKINKTFVLIIFALVTPVAALLALYLGENIAGISSALIYVVAIVTGAFLHISTTIFYESGSKQHEVSGKKIMTIIIGLLLAYATLLME